MNTLDSLTLVAALHGNETTPFFALQSVGHPVVLGNPRAAHEGKRYIERDLNASFGTPSGDTLEERRARELLALIPAHAPVIDFHTFSCKSPPFVVIVDSAQIELARRTGIPRIVLMTHNIKSGRALINHRAGISPEVGAHGSDTAWDTTLDIMRALSGVPSSDAVELYEAFGIIEEGGDYENFSPHPAGFVPVLSGERAYQHHGLKTRRIR